MIGKWNKSVILTHIGLSLAIIGIYLAISGHNIKYAIICLMFSGVCDAFDGTIARKCKRNQEEKKFGIELDSIVDAISFGAFPIVIYLSLGYNSIYYLPVYIIYGICGVTRLAYFNTMLENNKTVKYYCGFPITCISIFLPNIYLLSYVLNKEIFSVVFILCLLIISILYVLNIKVPKPSVKVTILFAVGGFLLTALYLFVL